MLQVTGTSLQDFLKGNTKDNVFIIGQGGNDTIDGYQGTNTVDLAASDTGLVVDLRSNDVASNHRAFPFTPTAVTPNYTPLSMAKPTLTLIGNQGSFTLTHEGNPAVVTFPLPAGKTLAEEIQSQLEGLGSIDPGDIGVSETVPGVFEIEFFNNTISQVISTNASNLIDKMDGTIQYDGTTTNTLSLTGNAGSFNLIYGAGGPANTATISQDDFKRVGYPTSIAAIASPEPRQSGCDRIRRHIYPCVYRRNRHTDRCGRHVLQVTY